MRAQRVPSIDNLVNGDKFPLDQEFHEAGRVLSHRPGVICGRLVPRSSGEFSPIDKDKVHLFRGLGKVGSKAFSETTQVVRAEAVDKKDGRAVPEESVHASPASGLDFRGGGAWVLAVVQPKFNVILNGLGLHVLVLPVEEGRKDDATVILDPENIGCGLSGFRGDETGSSDAHQGDRKSVV